MTTPNKIVPLARKATLVSVTISQWTARKLDKKVTDKVNTENHASDDAGRYNKLLIAKEHLAEITSIVTRARATHYKMTQPWADEGPRILPNALYTKFTEEFRTLKREFHEAADRFAAGYPSFIEERKVSLNGLFKESDYPKAEEIRSKFELDLNFSQLPDVEDFRSDLDDDIVDEIRSQVQASANNVVDTAMKNTVERIVTTVGHMAAKLAEYKPAAGPGDKSEGVFRDSLVENVRSLAELLPAFNLTNDPRITEIAERINRELCAEDAKNLRESDHVRAAVQKSADEIVAAVSDLFG